MYCRLQDLLKQISKKDFEDYYITENHSLMETTEHFKISPSATIRLIQEYNLKKPKDKKLELTRKTKLEKYGSENYQNVELIAKVKKERYGSSTYNNRDKAKKTCIEKYGVDNPFKDVEKIKQSYIDKLGVEHPMHDKSIKEKCLENRDYKQIWEKASNTYKSRTGYTNAMHNPEAVKKMLKSKIDNGVYDSPGTSGIERRLEKILNRKFDTVISKYRDVRYARESGYQFECDFYIPEIDLFIELNAHPTHGNYPFNCNNEKDVSELKRLRESMKPWDNMTAECWGVRDVEKMDAFKRNNLNYIVLYPSNTMFENTKFNPKHNSNLVKYLFKKLVIEKH